MENIRKNKFNFTLCNTLQGKNEDKEKKENFLASSILNSKISIWVHYSNLITIEDMIIENSNYYITSNGFLSTHVQLKSFISDEEFEFSDCVFRIFPKTYNYHKYYVLDHILNKNHTRKTDESFFKDALSKLESEIFNNLDIINNKMNDPVRYGDVIMLMHENSHKFLKYDHELKKFLLSNHDSENTLFIVEPSREIMKNDDQILKSGQPVKLKVASFSHVHQDLFLCIHFTNKNFGTNSSSEIHLISKENRKNSSSIIKNNKKSNKISNYNINSYQDLYTFSDKFNKFKLFNELKKNYFNKPELIAEEKGKMDWRINLYNWFTKDENIINCGDMVNILHCTTNSYFSVENSHKFSIKETFKTRGKDTRKNNIDNDIDSLSEISLIHDIQDFNDVFNHDTELVSNNINYGTGFCIKIFNDINKNKLDIGTCFVIEGIFPNMKTQSFLRFYNNKFLDSYRMCFRLKSFHNNKYLTLKKLHENEEYNSYICNSLRISDSSDEYYKFELVDSIKEMSNEYLLSSEYRYSLFSFCPSINDSSKINSKVKRNEFLRIFHVESKCYLKISPKHKNVDLNKSTELILTLTPNQEDKEIYKIIPLQSEDIWNFRFLKNIFNLLGSIVKHFSENWNKKNNEKNFSKNEMRNSSKIDDDNDDTVILLNQKLTPEELQEEKEKFHNFNYLFNSDIEESQRSNFSSNNLEFKYSECYNLEKLKYKKIKSNKFILDKLNNFVKNKFINKFDSKYDFNSVVFERQLLISDFGFCKLILDNFIYEFWIQNEMENLKKYINLIRSKNYNSNSIDFLKKCSEKEKILKIMFIYTEEYFKFLKYLCQDNINTKTEVYKYFYVLFFFLNISHNCIECLIEVLKDNPVILQEILTDCEKRDDFKSSLNLLKNSYFPHLDVQKPNFNLIDLIIEYIKISEYEDNGIIIANVDCLVISTITRNVYIEILKELVNNKFKKNVINNKKSILERVIIKDGNDENFKIVDFLEKSIDSQYSPCLIELIIAIAEGNQDDKMQIFIKNLFIFDHLKIMALNDEEKNNLFSSERQAAYLKMLSYLIRSNSIGNHEQEEYIINKILNKFLERKEENYNIKPNEKNKFKLLISKIQFIENLYVRKIRTNIFTRESEILTHLMTFLIRDFFLNHQKSLHFEESSYKQIHLQEKINKLSFSNYNSIGRAWLNTFLVFKNFMSRIDEEDYILCIIDEKNKKENTISGKRFSKVKVTSVNNYSNFSSERENLINKDSFKSISNEHSSGNAMSVNMEVTKLGMEVLMGSYSRRKTVRANEVLRKLHNKDEKGNSAENILEDEKKKNKLEVMSKIIDLFSLLVKQNNQIILENFLRYYKDNEKHEFSDFVKKCVPGIYSSEINSFISQFMEDDNKFNQSLDNQLFNYQKLIRCEEYQELNFVHYLLIVFNLSSDLELQESVLSLIYRSFTKRRKFFKTIVNYNGYSINILNDSKSPTSSNPENTRELKIKIVIEDLFNNYEKIKYDKMYYETLYNESYDFLKHLLKETFTFFSIKEEDSNNIYDSSILEKENQIIDKLTRIQNINDVYFLEFKNIIVQIFFFISKNQDLYMIKSIRETTFKNYKLFSLMTNFFDLGEKLIKDMDNESDIQIRRNGMEIYFRNMGIILLVFIISSDKKKKNLNLINNHFHRYKSIFYRNVHYFLMFLLLLTDLESKYFNLKYYDIMFEMREFNLYLSSNEIMKKEEFSEEVHLLYIEILIKVLKYATHKNKIIIESNLDELIIENLCFLLGKLDLKYFIYLNRLQKKTLITSVLYAFNKILMIESLHKKLVRALDVDPFLHLKIPKPQEIFEIIKVIILTKKITTNPNKKFDRILTLFKYIILYNHKIDKKYFEKTVNKTFLFVYLSLANGFELDTSVNLEDIIKDDANILILLSFIKFYSKKNIHHPIITINLPILRNNIFKTIRNFLTFYETSENLNTINIKEFLYLTGKLESNIPSCFLDKSEEWNLLRNKLFNLKANFIEKISLNNCRKEKYEIFKHNLFNKKNEILKLGNNEAECLVYYILNLLQKRQKEAEILYCFLNRLVEFIYKTTIYKKSSSTVKLNKFFLYIISRILRFYYENEEFNDGQFIRNFKKKTLSEIQIIFEKTGIIEKFLKIISLSYNNYFHSEISYIIDCLNQILINGNTVIQDSFYKNFKQDTLSNEGVFKYFYDLFTRKISNLVTNKTFILREKKKKIIENVAFFKFFKENIEQRLDTRALHFLQLLCEGHNKKLQNYLRFQEDNRKSFDLVSITNQYFHALYLNLDVQSFYPFIMCLDVMTEFTQGPCCENQDNLVQSTLLHTINEIIKNFCEINEETEKVYLYQMTLITYKSSILLLSLVEARTKDEDIYKKVSLVIDPVILDKACNKIYESFIKYLNPRQSSLFSLKIKYFNLFQNFYNEYQLVIENNLKTLKYSYPVIVETGFYFFFVLQYINDYKKQNKQKLIFPEIKIKALANIQYQDFILFLLYNFCYDLILLIVDTFKMIFIYLIYLFSLGFLKLKRIKSIFRNKPNKLDVHHFYRSNTRNIEILKNNQIFKIYFIYWPYCYNLKEYEKITFLENIDRTNSKTKLTDILRISIQLKHELEMEYNIKSILDKIPLLGIIFKHIELWKDFSLLLALLQNLSNFSYRRNPITNEMEKVLFFLDESGKNIFKKVIVILVDDLAFVQIAMATVIVIEFLFRKVPSIINIILEEQKEIRRELRKFFFVKNFISRTLFNIEVIYYLGYITTSILGKVSSDFYFAFLLVELILRFKTLKNVLMSVRNPIKELFLMLILWIISMYFFTLIIYAYFLKNIKPTSVHIGCSNYCDYLFQCLANMFYFNNKYDMGISNIFEGEIIDAENRNPVTPLFWLKTTEFIFVKLLFSLVVGGIIIDNFALLRNKELEMINDMTNVCTICGQKRQDIEKTTSTNGHNFQEHIKYDHNIFNYIYYIIYLHKKDPNEFTGFDSYVSDLAFNQKDISWFPMNKIINEQRSEDVK